MNTARPRIRSLAVSGAVLIIFIALCHEVVGAKLFPFGPAIFGGPIGWHALGIGCGAAALLLLLGVLDVVRVPVVALCAVFVLFGAGIAAHSALNYDQFHFFAVALVFAAIGVAACYRISRRRE